MNMSEWHTYSNRFCTNVCGVLTITCMFCETKGHCKLFPNSWIRCCIEAKSTEGHIYPFHIVFCSKLCEFQYHQAVHREKSRQKCEELFYGQLRWQTIGEKATPF
jgi:hypothetical protein